MVGGYPPKANFTLSSKKNDAFVIFTLQETKNSNLLDKNYTPENVEVYIQHEESWLT